MTTLSVSGPDEVLAILPYQLGYHPADAVVVVAIHDGTVGMIVRSDLPPGPLVCEVAGGIVGPVLRTEPDGVLLVGYESAESDAGPLLEILAADFRRAELDVRDVIVVAAGRWRSLICDDDCCPPDGRPVADTTRTPAVAEYIALGVAPLPDRDSLADLIRAPDSAPGVARAIRELRQRDRTALASARGPAWHRLCHLGEGSVPVDGLTDTDVAIIVESLRDKVWRDAVLDHLCPGILTPENVPPPIRAELALALPDRPWVDRDAGGERGEGHEVVAARLRLVARLQTVIRRTPRRSSAPLLTVLAHIAWVHGDGALARTALDQGLEVEPGYRLATLLLRMVDLAIRPTSA